MSNDFQNLYNIQTDVKNLWQTMARLKYTLEGEDGQGGMKAMVAQIAAQQKADSQVIRLAIWFPSVISLISIMISLIAFLR